MAALPQTIIVPCPGCGKPMPPVPVEITTEKTAVSWEVSMMPLLDDPDWVAAVYETHQDCVDPDES